MRRTGTSLMIVTMLIAGVTVAYSHHSFSAVYDGSKRTTVTGTVTQFRFVNPHALMYVDGADSSGKTTKWVVEFDGRLNLSNVGWSENTIKSGEHVTVTGNPSHTEPHRLFFIKLVHADGTELVRGADRANALEEERKQRVREHEQQK